MRILAALLSVLTTVPFVLAIGFDLHKTPHRAHGVFFTKPATRHDPGCPPNRLQPDGKLPVMRTLETKGMFHISRTRPDQWFTSNGWASVTPRDKCTIFVVEFDVKQAFGKTCNLVFDLPLLRNAPGLYRIVGPGQFTFHTFSPLAPPPKLGVMWNTQPPLDSSPPLIIKELIPGSSYVLESGPCYFPLGNKDKVVRSGMLCSPHTSFQFKQSDLRCPLGLFTIITDPFRDQ